MKRVPRVATTDRELRQVQEHILAAVEPILDGVRPELVTSDRLPRAAREYAGKALRVKDRGAPESLRICLEKSDGTYAWVTLATAPA